MIIGNYLGSCRSLVVVSGVVVPRQYFYVVVVIVHAHKHACIIKLQRKGPFSSINGGVSTQFKKYFKILCKIIIIGGRLIEFFQERWQ